MIYRLKKLVCSCAVKEYLINSSFFLRFQTKACALMVIEVKITPRNAFNRDYFGVDNNN